MGLAVRVVSRQTLKRSRPSKIWTEVSVYTWANSESPSKSQSVKLGRSLAPEVKETIFLDSATQQTVSFVMRGSNFLRRICDTIFYEIAFYRARTRRGRTAVARVFPQHILPMYTIWKTCKLLGLRITQTSEKPSDVCIYWQDTTGSTPPQNVPGLINARCTDIGKDVVQERFARVFGYPLAIDVSNHTGPCVRKSRRNFAHDGTIMTGPIRPEVDFVYERLIDNTVDDGWEVVDLRTVIVGTQIPVVFLLYRSISDRFGTDSRSGELVDVDAVFSRNEQQLIVTLAQAMGLDYGELDILRDSADGRVYVVDVNKTPVGPPRPLMLGDRHRAMRLVANAFAAEFLVAPRLHLTV